ncbi:MAG TPA: hypothetical protein VF767_10130 [Bryobacteraceae bacterium]
MSGDRFGRRSLVLGVPAILAAQQRSKEEEVSPAEDLMREHGVLKRALLVYGECINRLEGRKALPPEVVTGTANLIRRFIEAKAGGLSRDESARRGLAGQMRMFIRMYEPHEAREDTVLFPALQSVGVHDLSQFTPRV